MMERLFDVLELATHAALIVGALMVAWIYWHSGDTSAFRSGHTVTIDSSAVLRTWRPTDRRVLLFVSPTCPYCNRSMDFYARLGRTVDSMQQTNAPVALAAVISGANSPRAQRQVLRDAKVEVDTLLTLSSRSFRPVGVSSVPTVAIQSSKETSPSTWVGLQDSTGEQEILSAVRALGTSP